MTLASASASAEVEVGAKVAFSSKMKNKNTTPQCRRGIHRYQTITTFTTAAAVALVAATVSVSIISTSTVVSIIPVVQAFQCSSPLASSSSLSLYHLHSQQRTRRSLTLTASTTSTILFQQLNNDHFEMAFEREGPGGQASTNNDNNNSNKKMNRKMKHKLHRKKIRNNKTGTRTGKDSSVDGAELASHVSAQYTTGPGGILKEAASKRKRQEAQGLVAGTEEQLNFLKKLDRHPALVLNADYQPLSVLPLSLWTWQDTIKAVFSGKVNVVDTYPDVTIKAVAMEIPLPSVIALTDYVKQPHQTPAFTRRNVFLRDGYTCQYCTKLYKTNDLSLDHVVPRCVGGKLEWENAVTCCRSCNSRKGSLLPTDLRAVGMKLVRKPKVPTKYELAAEAGKMVPRRVHPTWKPYLGFNEFPSKEMAADTEQRKAKAKGGSSGRVVEDLEGFLEF